MILKTRIAPPNSIIFIENPEHGFPPSITGYELVTANSSCVAVGTLCEMDGETSIVLSDKEKTEQEATILVFDESIETPTQEISVITSDNKDVLRMPTKSERTPVQVWVNRNAEPDLIEIIIG
jgi:hypothetical protein